MEDYTDGHRSSTELPSKGAIESLKLKVGDHQVHYFRVGSGPPVVLLHGGASDSRDWVETMAALSHACSFYAPDLIGYGLSERNKSGYYLSDFVESVLGFIDTLDLHSPVMVGHSLGGRVCLEIALHHPERVHRLVLIDTAGFGRLTCWGKFLGMAAWGVRRALGRRQPYPRFLNDHGHEKDWTCLEKLPIVEVPTLIVWSRRDPYYPLAGALRARELIPNSRLEIFPGYGHAPHVQRRGYFNSLLLSFLDDG
jgi:pimeloyl-ACP methyl ester carboxylesterase